MEPAWGRCEKHLDEDCAPLMASADDLFWTRSLAAAYCRFAIVNYISFRDLGMYLAGGRGGANWNPEIAKTNYLEKAAEFRNTLCRDFYGWIGRVSHTRNILAD